MSKPNILLTNDDGIRSPGLWAAAEALSQLGFVTVVAPREQSSGAGRSLPVTSNGIIYEEMVEVGGQQWKVFSVGGTPAQAVEYTGSCGWRSVMLFTKALNSGSIASIAGEWKACATGSRSVGGRRPHSRPRASTWSDRRRSACVRQ